MSARVLIREGHTFNRKEYLLRHAMGANAAVWIDSAIVAAFMFAAPQGMGIINNKEAV